MDNNLLIPRDVVLGSKDFIAKGGVNPILNYAPLKSIYTDKFNSEGRKFTKGQIKTEFEIPLRTMLAQSDGQNDLTISAQLENGEYSKFPLKYTKDANGQSLVEKDMEAGGYKFKEDAHYAGHDPTFMSYSSNMGNNYKVAKNIDSILTESEVPDKLKPLVTDILVNSDHSPTPKNIQLATEVAMVKKDGFGDVVSGLKTMSNVYTNNWYDSKNSSIIDFAANSYITKESEYLTGQGFEINTDTLNYNNASQDTGNAFNNKRPLTTVKFQPKSQEQLAMFQVLAKNNDAITINNEGITVEARARDWGAVQITGMLIGGLKYAGRKIGETLLSKTFRRLGNIRKESIWSAFGEAAETANDFSGAKGGLLKHLEEELEKAAKENKNANPKSIPQTIENIALMRDAQAALKESNALNVFTREFFNALPEEILYTTLGFGAAWAVGNPVMKAYRAMTGSKGIQFSGYGESVGKEIQDKISGQGLTPELKLNLFNAMDNANGLAFYKQGLTEKMVGSWYKEGKSFGQLAEDEAKQTLDYMFKSNQGMTWLGKKILTLQTDEVANLTSFRSVDELINSPEVWEFSQGHYGDKMSSMVKNLDLDLDNFNTDYQHLIALDYLRETHKEQLAEVTFKNPHLPTGSIFGSEEKRSFATIMQLTSSAINSQATRNINNLDVKVANNFIAKYAELSEQYDQVENKITDAVNEKYVKGKRLDTKNLLEPLLAGEPKYATISDAAGVQTQKRVLRRKNVDGTFSIGESYYLVEGDNKEAGVGLFLNEARKMMGPDELAKTVKLVTGPDAQKEANKLADRYGIFAITSMYGSQVQDYTIGKALWDALKFSNAEKLRLGNALNTDKRKQADLVSVTTLANNIKQVFKTADAKLFAERERLTPKKALFEEFKARPAFGRVVADRKGNLVSVKESVKEFGLVDDLIDITLGNTADKFNPNRKIVNFQRVQDISKQLDILPEVETALVSRLLLKGVQGNTAIDNKTQKSNFNTLISNIRSGADKLRSLPSPASEQGLQAQEMVFKMADHLDIIEQISTKLNIESYETTSGLLATDVASRFTVTGNQTMLNGFIGLLSTQSAAHRGIKGLLKSSSDINDVIRHTPGYMGVVNTADFRANSQQMVENVLSSEMPETTKEMFLQAIDENLYMASNSLEAGFNTGWFQNGKIRFDKPHNTQDYNQVDTRLSPTSDAVISLKNLNYYLKLDDSKRRTLNPNDLVNMLPSLQKFLVEAGFLGVKIDLNYAKGLPNYAVYPVSNEMGYLMRESGIDNPNINRNGTDK